MPCFYFDLVTDNESRDQGGMILENQEAAVERADDLAGELAIVRPELKRRRASVRVLDENDTEIYRTPLNTTAFPLAPAE